MTCRLRQLSSQIAATACAAETTVSGSCNCGEIKYSLKVQGDALPILFCHCKDCREAHGSPFTAVVIAPENQITWTNKDKMLAYNRRGTNKRQFCKICGAHMCSELTGIFAVFAPSIKDCPIPMKPSAHIYVSEKDPLITLPEDGLPRAQKTEGVF